MTSVERVRLAFSNRYGSPEGVRLFRAPARVNLIGEHTDYNDGFVLPVAIDRQVIIAARVRSDRTVHIHSVQFDEDVHFSLEESDQRKHSRWGSLVECTVRGLEGQGQRLGGADVLIDSDISIGAGLASSAAITTAVAYGMLSLGNIPTDSIDIARVCQRAEQESSAAMVGIMDPFISANAVLGTALLLDCRSLQYEVVPVDISRYALVVCDTGVPHELAASAYNDRRRECEEAAKVLGVASLRDVTLEYLETRKPSLPEVLFRRACHVIAENARTLAAATALRDGDFERVGRLMLESHISLRDDYEVSCRELDVLVDSSTKIPGVAGMRMTGGGFGGCTVGFVERERFKEFSVRTTRTYEEQTGRTLKIYECEIVGGASEL